MYLSTKKCKYLTLITFTKQCPERLRPYGQDIMWFLWSLTVCYSCNISLIAPILNQLNSIHSRHPITKKITLYCIPADVYISQVVSPHQFFPSNMFFSYQLSIMFVKCLGHDHSIAYKNTTYQHISPVRVLFSRHQNFSSGPADRDLPVIIFLY
jgi:hypothetical protein